MTNYDTLNEAYLGAMVDLVRGGVSVSPRGLPTREIRNHQVTIENPSFGPIQTMDLERNRILASYMEQEMRLYRAGELKASVWRDEASKFWWELRNPDDTVNSNYGHLTLHLRDAPGSWYNRVHDRGTITQWQWAKECLSNDRHTRQAVMHFNRTNDQWVGNRDFPCTMNGVFAIRDDRLHYTIRMRSQDVVKGWPYDVPFFIWQLEKMAQEVTAGVGTYCHFVDSLHMYEQDLDTVLRMTGDATHVDHRRY